jgi:glycosyltransferase involved in cell wall biosynthesis
VAYLGQITPRKGVSRLVEAFADGALAPARLVVAGAARGMADPGGEGVLFTGTLEGADRLALLVDADVLVYPSTDEIFGLVPMEGLLCGAPAVVGGDCGCGELIAEAGAGLLTRHGDIEELRRPIRALLRDRDAAARMVERGRRYVSAHLDPAEVARAHQEMYRTILDERAGAAR